MSVTGTSIAILATDGVEQREFSDPKASFEAAGVRTSTLSDHTGSIALFAHLTEAGSASVDVTVEHAKVSDFSALVLPGGVANPDALRLDPAAVAFIREFVESGKPVAAICHAPWLLIEAGVVANRTVTSWPSLKTDLVNAGATWVDQDVVRDGNLVTSRRPDDIPAFTAAVLDMLGVDRLKTEEDIDETLDESFPASDPPSLSGPALPR